MNLHVFLGYIVLMAACLHQVFVTRESGSVVTLRARLVELCVD